MENTKEVKVDNILFFDMDRTQIDTSYTNILQMVSQQLTNILLEDLPLILRRVGKNSLTVCITPRVKANYSFNQRLFNTTVSNVVNRLANFPNGTNYIVRHTNTKTTHMNKSGYGDTSICITKSE